MQESPQGTVTVEMGEHRVELAPGTPLQQTLCSCPATSICWHRVLAVLAYQQSGHAPAPAADDWAPGEVGDEDLVQFLGASLVARARKVIRGGFPVELRRSPPTALLPTCTVEFLVPGELSYARCDCSHNGPCEHIAQAVWAFREAPLGRVVLGGGDIRAEGSLAATQGLVEELGQDGVVHAATDLAQRFKEAAQALRKEGFLWMSALAEEIGAQLRAYHDRDASYESAALAHLVLEWQARRGAALSLSQPRILGRGVAPETALEHIRLTGLGVRVETVGGNTRAEVYLADPDTSTVLVLTKQWAGEQQGPGLSGRRVHGTVSLGGLAAGQLVTNVARRRADRSLVLGRSRVGRSQVLPQTGNWSELLRPPLLVERFAALKDELVQDRPALLRPRVRAENVRVLRVETVEEVAYDPGCQQLRALLLDGEGEIVELRLEHRSAIPGALSSLAAELAKKPRFVSGSVAMDQGRLWVEPLAVVPSDQGPRLPALASESSLLGESLREVSFRAPAEDELQSALQQAHEALVGALHRGLRFGDAVDPGAELGRRLKDLGLESLGSALLEVAGLESWFSAALRHHLTAYLCQLGLE